MKFIAPREGANAPRTRSFLKLYWFFYLVVLFAAPQMDAMAVNYPPRANAVDPLSIKLQNGAVTKNVGPMFDDANGESLRITAWSSSNTSVATVSMSHQGAIITPVAVGTATVSITATDQGGLTATATISVTVYDNLAPTGSLSDVALTTGGSASTVDLSSSFSDPDGDTLTFTASSSHTMYVTVSVSGSTLSLTPVAWGSSDISVTANDGKTSTTVKFLASVTSRPPTGSLSDVSLTTGGSAKTINLTNSFTDPDGDVITFTASSSDTSHVTTSVSAGAAGSYTLSLTPVAAGSSSISVTADDRRGGTTTVSFTATVSAPANNAPTLTGSLSDVGLTTGGGAHTIDLSSSFTDPDGDTLTFTASSSQTSYVTVSVSSSTLTLTPVAAGSSSISVTASDGTASATASFTATVTLPQVLDDPPESDPPPDQTPEIPPLEDLTPTPNSPPTGSLLAVTLTEGGSAKTINLSNSFSDPDGDTLSFTASSSQTSYVTASVSGSTLTLTPVAAGSSSISVTANDGTASATASFTATVVPRGSSEAPPNNRPPVVVGSVNPVTLVVGESRSVQVQFSDPDGDTLSYSVSGGNSAVSVGISGNTVTVTGRAAGQATLTVTATDPHGATATQTIDVTVSQLRQAIPRTATALSKVSGDNQSAPIGTALSEPLVVEVRDGQQRAIQGVSVQFELSESGPALESTPTTDANGQASATLMFGDTTGEFAVEVSVAGINEPVVFTATAISSSLDVEYIDSLEVEPNPDDLTMNRVYGVSFSPDGQTLASAHGDRSVRMWDVETRELERTLGGSLIHSSIERRGHRYAAHSVAFSPDGNILASGGKGGRVLLWDANTGRLKQFMLRHAGAVWGLAFSPDGNTLAAATEGGYVYVYDISNLKSVERKHRLRAHSERAWSVAFSPDGEFLASSGGDALVRLWDYETGRAIKTLRGHEEQVLSIAFGAGEHPRQRQRGWHGPVVGCRNRNFSHTFRTHRLGIRRSVSPERGIPCQHREGYERTTLGYDIWGASQHAGTSHELGT